MRIGIDHRPSLSGRGGIAVYVRELVAALAVAYPEDRLELYGHRLRQDTALPAVIPANARLHRSHMPAPALALAARAGLGADRLLGAVDVMHWTDFVRLRSTRAPVVATVHDLLFDELPHCYTKAMGRRLRDVTRHIVVDARRIIVPAAATRNALCERYGADETRVHVVPHGRTPLPDAPPAVDCGRYVLAVGTLEPRKNHLRLFAAFDRLHAYDPELRLVVVGARGWMDDEIVEAMQRRSHIAYEGAVDDARLSALYAGALVVAYPSLGEGFGLPVLEAMASGRAVLVGAGSVPAELAGDAALAVDPYDETALHDALERLTQDAALREALAARGVSRAEPYTWARAAEMTRQVYELAIHA